MYQGVKYSGSGGEIQCIRRSNASYQEVNEVDKVVKGSISTLHFTSRYASFIS